MLLRVGLSSVVLCASGYLKFNLPPEYLLTCSSCLFVVRTCLGCFWVALVPCAPVPPRTVDNFRTGTLWVFLVCH